MKKIGYRTADDVTTKLGVPVLAVVPDMAAAAAGGGHQRRRRHFKLALVLVAAVVVCGALAWLLI